MSWGWVRREGEGGACRVPSLYDCFELSKWVSKFIILGYYLGELCWESYSRHWRPQRSCCRLQVLEQAPWPPALLFPSSLILLSWCDDQLWIAWCSWRSVHCVSPRHVHELCKILLRTKNQGSFSKVENVNWVQCPSSGLKRKTKTKAKTAAATTQPPQQINRNKTKKNHCLDSFCSILFPLCILLLIIQLPSWRSQI